MNLVFMKINLEHVFEQINEHWSPRVIAVIYDISEGVQRKLEEYNRYERDIAEPIDRDAQQHGAFISVTTYVSEKRDSPWTHMRIFVLKDRAQLENLSKEPDAAGVRLQPDEAKRKARAEYAATLGDAVGQEVVDILSEFRK